MPGVLLCEAAAQVCASARQFLEEPYQGFVGFGGITEARFRAPVPPGVRLVIAAKVEKKHRLQWIWKCQGFVGGKLHFNVGIIGVHM
jgi:3-hydroxyacyl-[acyl-carrier-protein] dehydratase